MKKISTGEDSTLGVYRSIALIISGDKDNKAVKFFDKIIKNSLNGEQTEVWAAEFQMMYLIFTLAFGDSKKEEENNAESI